MEDRQIIKELDEEIARLKEVRALLSGKAGATRGRGNSAGTAGKRHNRLSEAGRRRISAALKRRWAARRKAQAKAARRSRRG